jgi:hypothetical protein
MARGQRLALSALTFPKRLCRRKDHLDCTCCTNNGARQSPANGRKRAGLQSDAEIKGLVSFLECWSRRQRSALGFGSATLDADAAMR